MSRIKTVLFDLDDTLFDHLYAAKSSLAAIRPDLPRFARERPEMLEAEYSNLLEEVHLRVLAGEIDLDDARRERMRELMSGGEDEPTAEAVDAMARRFRSGYQENRRVVAGTMELLRELRGRGVTIGIITNNQTKEQVGKLAFTGLDEYIDFMVTSEEVGPPKPDPEMFYIALKRAGCTKDEAVVVGDSWASDITGAKNAGIRAVWYNPRRLPRPDDGDPEVGEMRSLLPTPEATQKILGV